MNEDDYDFDANEKLSALFGRDLEASNSSLIYKAPKQPGEFSNNVRPTSSKTFHKYINLYNKGNGKLYGKYIIAIVASELHPSEILIYQTKTNIFIRFPVHGKILHSQKNNYSLILNEDIRQYELQFGNFNELFDFTREYKQNGGLIEMYNEKELSHHDTQNIEVSHEKSPHVEALEKNTITSNKSEKSNILNRLEKMGLQQLLPTQNKVDDNCTTDEVNTYSNVISEASSLKNEDEDLSAHPSVSDEMNQPKKNITSDPESLITHEQTGLLTSILAENQRNNFELREAISALTSKLKEIIPSTESEYENKVKKLESKIKSLELQSENLQSELRKCHKKYREQDNLKCVPEKNENDKRCQTDNLEKITEDYVQLESVIMKIMDVVKSLPLTSDEINKFKRVKESVENVESISGLQYYFELIQEKNTTDVHSEAVSRNEFVVELKKIMNDMYQNIFSSEGRIATKELIAKQIKLATLEIMKNYDISMYRKQI